METVPPGREISSKNIHRSQEPNNLHDNERLS
jgi:hypothetical protein